MRRASWRAIGGHRCLPGAVSSVSPERLEEIRCRVTHVAYSGELAKGFFQRGSSGRPGNRFGSALRDQNPLIDNDDTRTEPFYDIKDMRAEEDRFSLCGKPAQDFL